MKELGSRTWNWIIAVSALVFVIGTWLWVRTRLPTAGADLAQWTIAGTTGDAFGALNALFSGLAFAGVLLALKMQHDELVEQRKASNSDIDDRRRERLAIAYSAWLKDVFEFSKACLVLARAGATSDRHERYNDCKVRLVASSFSIRIDESPSKATRVKELTGRLASWDGVDDAAADATVAEITQMLEDVIAETNKLKAG